MNGFIIFVLGIILLNSLFSLIPTIFPNSDPGVYIPYQAWFNSLLLFNLLLPKRKGEFLYKENIIEEGQDSSASKKNSSSSNSASSYDIFKKDVVEKEKMYDNPMNTEKSSSNNIPSAPPIDNVSSQPSTPQSEDIVSYSGLTRELNPDGSFPPNYDIYASRAD